MTDDIAIQATEFMEAHALPDATMRQATECVRSGEVYKIDAYLDRWVTETLLAALSEPPEVRDCLALAVTIKTHALLKVMNEVAS